MGKEYENPAVVKPFGTMDALGVVSLDPLVETLRVLQDSFPSTSPDPTESFHLYCSSLKYFAAITSVMRHLLALLNLLRCSFKVINFPPSFCSAILRVEVNALEGYT